MRGAFGVRIAKPRRTVFGLLEGGECRLRFFGKYSMKGCSEVSFAEAKLQKLGNISLAANNCEPFWGKVGAFVLPF